MKILVKIFAIALIATSLSLSAKEPTNIMMGFGIGAGQSKIDIRHSQIIKDPITDNPGATGTPTLRWNPQQDMSLASWAVAWEFLIGYKHFINDYVGFRYYGNVGVQHYKPSMFESKTQTIGFVDYTLNADMLINFYESDLLSVGILGGIGFGGTSFDKKAINQYMAVYDRNLGRPIGIANISKHFFNVNASVGARLTLFQKVRQISKRVCDNYNSEGRRTCRVPYYYIGHSIEFNAKFPLMDYSATPLPDVVQINGAWVSRPEYVVKNPYRLTVRYVIDF